MPMSQPTSAPTGIVRPSRPAIPLSPPPPTGKRFEERSGPPHVAAGHPEMPRRHVQWCVSLDARPGPESPQPPRLAANWHCSTVTTGHPPIAPPRQLANVLRSGPAPPHVHAHVPSPPGRQLALFDRHDRPTHPWFPATTPKALLGRQCQLANWQDRHTRAHAHAISHHITSRPLQALALPDPLMGEVVFPQI
ncbi:hypothetical protein MAP00_009252 [Monascus purpureus]|nr:hypothetical protein MAP00_009252 [Monascus purpureus]